MRRDSPSSERAVLLLVYTQFSFFSSSLPPCNREPGDPITLREKQPEGGPQVERRLFIMDRLQGSKQPGSHRLGTSRLGIEITHKLE